MICGLTAGLCAAGRTPMLLALSRFKGFLVFDTFLRAGRVFDGYTWAGYAKIMATGVTGKQARQCLPIECFCMDSQTIVHINMDEWVKIDNFGDGELSQTSISPAANKNNLLHGFSS